MTPDSNRQPDPRTAPDDEENVASNEVGNAGVSAEEPAEGSDEIPPAGPGSPAG